MADMDISIHSYEFDVVKWVVDVLDTTTKSIGTECIEIVRIACLQEDYRDGHQRHVEPCTQGKVSEPAYKTLNESLVLNHWFRTLKLVRPPPSGLDILDIVSDDTRKGVLWKRAVKEMVHRSWKDQTQT